MPKSKETATTAVYQNNGQEFDSKRAADNYGVIVDQVTEFNDDEDFVENALEAYRNGVFNVPKVERKAKA
jgi:Asp-tRNA(Asn)/Glu-tRNA(Gln) amidotransferase C subunit